MRNNRGPYIKYFHIDIILKMARGEHIPFELKEFFHEDPFRFISSKRKRDTNFFNAYVDYSQDLQTLRIAWRRIKQGCKDISEIDTQIRGIQSNDIRDDDEAASLFFQEHGLMNMLQSDVRAFIDIARTIMDKVAKLKEKLLGLSPGKGHWPLKTFDNDPSFMS
jgi:hypothetical protein